MVPIVMPSFGMYTAEGRIASWLVPPGSHVEKGQPILEIETDKAVQEVIAPDSGTLQSIVAAGAVVKEEQLLGYVLAEGEAPIDVSASRTQAKDVETPRSQQSVPRPSTPPAASGRIVATPEARRLAAQHRIDLATVVGTGPGGRIVASDVSTLVSRGD